MLLEVVKMVGFTLHVFFSTIFKEGKVTVGYICLEFKRSRLEME